MSEKRLEFVHTKLVRDSWMYPSMYIQGPGDAIDVIRSLTGDLDREVVTVINLSNKGQVINASFVSVGTINMAPVSAPEVFRSGILSGAASVIALHNHPSGDITPSGEDRAAARRLATAGEIVGMKLLGFLVISDKAYYSFKEQEPECLEPREGLLVSPERKGSSIVRSTGSSTIFFISSCSPRSAKQRRQPSGMEMRSFRA